MRVDQLPRSEAGRDEGRNRRVVKGKKEEGKERRNEGEKK